MDNQGTDEEKKDFFTPDLKAKKKKMCERGVMMSNTIVKTER